MTPDEHAAIAASVAALIKTERERHAADLGRLIARIDALEQTKAAPQWGLTAGTASTAAQSVVAALKHQVRRALQPLEGRLAALEATVTKGGGHQ